MLRLNPELYAALEKWAADEFRSVNGQLEWLLDRTLSERGRATAKLNKNKEHHDAPLEKRPLKPEPSGSKN